MGRVFLGATLVLAALSGASDRAVAQINGSGDQTLRVFLDCGHRCDFDHFRREVPFVNYVRDRTDAQVHVLVTSQGTGGGGEMSFNFIGLREFQARQDTLIYRFSSTDTQDEIRDGMVRTFKIGLMPFIASSPLAQRITIGFTAPAQGQPAAAATPETDPWNFWVFRANVNGRLNGESQSSGFNLNGSLSANRTTEEWKINIRTSGRYSRDRFEFDDGTEFINTSENYSSEIFAVNSITNHWSVGGSVSANNSTFLNRDIKVSGLAAVEYDYFPYSESTRRSLTFLLSAGLSYFNYEETTIFDRDEETRPMASLEVGYGVRQPWGDVHGSVEATAFLHDGLRRHRIDVFAGFNVRVVRGLNFNMFGQFSRIKDQIHLSAAGISPEEVLTRRRQLGTDFSYFANFGLSYTFGSIFNNVVNPRMEGGDF